MKNFKISVVMAVALFVSLGVSAQRGRGHNNNRYQPYRNYNSYPRNHITIQSGPRYNYRPGYRPYYRYAPVYRPIARPIYRRPYVPFGPLFGVRINVLPRGYSRIYVGSNPYYYNDGVYYRSYSSGTGYEVVAPPLNATVSRLPANATVTMVDGQKYYQVGGTFYQEEFDENNRLSYRVVGTDGVLNTDNNSSMTAGDDPDAYATADIPVLGSRYDALPPDSKVQVINQQKYFVSGNGVYYKEVIEGDRIRYEVTDVQ